MQIILGFWREWEWHLRDSGAEKLSVHRLWAMTRSI